MRLAGTWIFPVVMLLVSLISAFFLCCLLIPSVWAAIIAGDDGFNIQESGIIRVSSRNPVRETGPPACMAKLIMMRHRLNQAKSRKRSNLGPNTFAMQPRGQQHPLTPFKSALPLLRASRTRNLAWIRFGKHLGKQYR